MIIFWTEIVFKSRLGSKADENSFFQETYFTIAVSILIILIRDILSNYLRGVIIKVGLKYGTQYELNDIKDYYMKSDSAVEKDLILRTLAGIKQQKM